MMLLSKLLPDVSLDEDVSIRGITDDSRRVTKGSLYIAIKGQKNDGRNYINEVENRVAAIPVSYTHLTLPTTPSV